MIPPTPQPDKEEMEALKNGAVQPLEEGLIEQKELIAEALQKECAEFSNWELNNQLFLNAVDNEFETYNSDGLRIIFDYGPQQYSGYLGIKRDGDGFTLKLRLFEHKQQVVFVFEDTHPAYSIKEIPEAAIDLFKRFLRDKVERHDGTPAAPERTD